MCTKEKDVKIIDRFVSDRVVIVGGEGHITYKEIVSVIYAKFKIFIDISNSCVEGTIDIWYLKRMEWNHVHSILLYQTRSDIEERKFSALASVERLEIFKKYRDELFRIGTEIVFPLPTAADCQG